MQKAGLKNVCYASETPLRFGKTLFFREGTVHL